MSLLTDLTKKWYNLTKEISESEEENMNPEVVKPEIIDTVANAGLTLINSPEFKGWSHL